MSYGGGGRICYSQRGGTYSGGSVSSDSWSGMDGRGGIGDGGSSDGMSRRVSKSVIADTDVRLAHTGEGSVDGLGVSGHLSQVTIAPQDVGVLGGDGGGGDGRGGGVTDGGSGGVTDGGGAEVPGVGDGHQGGEDHALKRDLRSYVPGIIQDILSVSCVQPCVLD